MRKAIVVDVSKCYACLACVVECSYRRAGAQPNERLSARTFGQAACEVESVSGEPVPLVCHHCEEAPCMAVCPSGAIGRDTDDAPVVLDPARCIGCHACIMACPFGMVRLAFGGRKAAKCDLCSDRVARGLKPACVSACPTGAIEYKELDEAVREVRKRVAAALRAAR